MRKQLVWQTILGTILLASFQWATPVYAQNAPAAQQRGSSKTAAASVHLSHDALVKLIRKKIKYVFVIYQENRSFDSYFGTFPGADGLFSKKPAQTPGFSQKLLDVDGKEVSVSPFRIGPEQCAADTDDIDHNHSVIVKKMDIQNGHSQMDRFAAEEQQAKLRQKASVLQAKQFGELAMAYEDCDTVPVLWNYAHKFVLFDHIFQLMIGPSTPGNLSIIGAQSGMTQWVRHPDEKYAGNGDSGAGVPMLDDALPFWGSNKDATPAALQEPYNPGQKKRSDTPQINLTFATLPLTLQGKELEHVVESDRDPKGDLDDVSDDVGFISKLGRASVPFGWYQEGFDNSPTERNPDCSNDDPVDANRVHASYITHHNGPQYFGYIANNPQMNNQLHDMKDFFAAVKESKLPEERGAFYIKGGYRNIFHLLPVMNDPKVRCTFRGDDDHPAYSDSQISEVLVATAINQIAASKYWPQSAIIITWDDSEGDYDHVPPPAGSKGPDGVAITNGPRVPLIVISPYARTQHIAHEQGNHASVVKFIDTVFNLPALASLPDEESARKLGKEKFGQDNLGPQDAAEDVTDLLAAFSAARLKGTLPALSPQYAQVPQWLLEKLPREKPYGCRELGITPTDHNQKNHIPEDFNPRPLTCPTGQNAGCKQPVPSCAISRQ
jgi:phospholipase C